MRNTIQSLISFVKQVLVYTAIFAVIAIIIYAGFKTHQLKTLEAEVAPIATTTAKVIPRSSVKSFDEIYKETMEMVERNTQAAMKDKTNLQEYHEGTYLLERCLIPLQQCFVRIPTTLRLH